MYRVHLPILVYPEHRLQALDMLASGRNPRTGTVLSASMIQALKEAVR